MNRQRTIESVWEIAEPLARTHGYDLVDVEFKKEAGRWVLRATVDRPGGISLDDCQAFSELLSPALDLRLPVAERYVLEVASPGLDRPLKRDADYRRFAGRQVEVRTCSPVDGRKRWVGKLVGLEDDVVVLVAAGTTVRIPRPQVARARLHFEGEPEPGRRRDGRVKL